ncbi:MAG: DUF6456 domain-containing protein [Rhizomicrobium sp.]
MAGGDERYSRQHQLRGKRRMMGADGKETLVTINEAESPLGRLRHRKVIDAAQFDAGERLRRDFTLARLTPRMGIDLTQPFIRNAGGQKVEAPLTDMVLAAKQRFAAAMRAAGPGLNDLLFDVCCHLRGLEEAERAKGWPIRSAKVVLCIGLDRLAEHYGLRVSGRAKMRGWQADVEER